MEIDKLRVRYWRQEIWTELATHSAFHTSLKSIGKSAHKDAGEPQAGMPALPYSPRYASLIRGSLARSFEGPSMVMPPVSRT